MNIEQQILALLPKLIKLNEKLNRRAQMQKNTIIAQGGIIHQQNEALHHLKNVVADLKFDIGVLRASNFEAETTIIEVKKQLIGEQINALMEPEDDGLTIPAFH